MIRHSSAISLVQDFLMTFFDEHDDDDYCIDVAVLSMCDKFFHEYLGFYFVLFN